MAHGPNYNYLIFVLHEAHFFVSSPKKKQQQHWNKWAIMSKILCSLETSQSTTGHHDSSHIDNNVVLALLFRKLKILFRFPFDLTMGEWTFLVCFFAIYCIFVTLHPEHINFMVFMSSFRLFVSSSFCVLSKNDGGDFSKAGSKSNKNIIKVKELKTEDETRFQLMMNKEGKEIIKPYTSQWLPSISKKWKPQTNIHLL